MSSMHSMNSPITVNLKPWLFLHTDSSLMLKQFYFWKIYAHMFIQNMYVCINITPRVLVTHKVIFEVFPFCTKQPNPQTSNPRSIIMTDIFSAVLNITFSIEKSCPCGLKKLKKKKKSVDSTVFSSGASACLRTHMNPEKGKGKKKASCNAILRHLSIKSNSLPLPPPIHTSSPHPSLVCLPHIVLMLYICQSERCRGGREQRNRERDGWPWRCHWYAPRCSLSPDKDPPPQSGYHQAFVCGIYIHGCSETRIIWYDAQIEMIHRRWAGCRINRAENASLSVQWYEQLLRLNILFQLWWEASCRGGGELKWADRRQRTILIAVSLPRSLSILSVCVPVLG